MTIQDAILAAEQRARDFHHEETEALRGYEFHRAHDCRVCAQALEQFTRDLMERALSDQQATA